MAGVPVSESVYECSGGTGRFDFLRAATQPGDGVGMTDPVQHAREFFEAHPEIDVPEAFVVDVNGQLRGKWVPVRSAAKVMKGQLRFPKSSFSLDIWGNEVPASGIGAAAGDPDGVCIPIPENLGVVTWTERPMAQLLLSMNDPDGTPSFADPRNVLAERNSHVALPDGRPSSGQAASSIRLWTRMLREEEASEGVLLARVESELDRLRPEIASLPRRLSGVEVEDAALTRGAEAQPGHEQPLRRESSVLFRRVQDELAARAEEADLWRGAPFQGPPRRRPQSLARRRLLGESTSLVRFPSLPRWRRPTPPRSRARQRRGLRFVPAPPGPSSHRREPATLSSQLSSHRRTCGAIPQSRRAPKPRRNDPRSFPQPVQLRPAVTRPRATKPIANRRQVRRSRLPLRMGANPPRSLTCLTARVAQTVSLRSAAIPRAILILLPRPGPPDCRRFQQRLRVVFRRAWRLPALSGSRAEGLPPGH